MKVRYFDSLVSVLVNRSYETIFQSGTFMKPSFASQMYKAEGRGRGPEGEGRERERSRNCGVLVQPAHDSRMFEWRSHNQLHAMELCTLEEFNITPHMGFIKSAEQFFLATEHSPDVPLLYKFPPILPDFAWISNHVQNYYIWVRV